MSIVKQKRWLFKPHQIPLYTARPPYFTNSLPNLRSIKLNQPPTRERLSSDYTTLTIFIDSKFTYIYCGYALELSVSVDEARSVRCERLLDARSGQLHSWLHQLMVVFIWVSAWSGCTFPIAIGCATLELAHLGQSVVVSARPTPFVVLSVRALGPSVILSCWGAPCRHCRVVLRHLRPVRWRYVGWVDLVRRLLSRHTPGPLDIDGLHSIVKSWMEHLSRFFWAVAPWLMLVHFFVFRFFYSYQVLCFTVGCVG